MATKRNLYRPAPKTNVGEKKTRKPLIQGRLMTDSVPVTVSSQVPHLAQGRLTTNDEVLDPTLTPMKSVPVLTEKTSPRPEPPSQCLDLSDADFDGNEVSELGRLKPVMVFDASHLGHSQNDTEVEVLVAYEDSPAKVICHTPGKLEQSFRGEKCKGPGGVGYGAGDSPYSTVLVDRVPVFSSSSGSRGSRRGLDSEDKENPKKLKEARNRANEESIQIISHQSRGIIEEILAQEMGDGNVEAISLNSESFSPPPPKSASGKSQQLSSGGSLSRSSPFQLLPVNSSTESLNSLKKSSSSRTKSKSERSDKEDHRSRTKAQDDTSESEVCSLYEYVPPKKAQGKQMETKKKSVTVVAKNAQEKTEAPAPARRKKTRTVASRYMQSSQNKANDLSKMSDPSLSQQHSRSRTIGTPSGKQSREKPQESKADKNREKLQESRVDKKSTKSSSGKVMGPGSNQISKEIDKNGTLPVKHVKEQIQQPIVKQLAMECSENCSDTEVDKKTSTPTREQESHFPHEIDVSAIHSISATSFSVGGAGQPGFSSKEKSGDKSSKHSHQKKPQKSSSNQSNGSTSNLSQLQLDMEYARYLQWAFLNSKSKKVVQDQDTGAIAQIHGLWKLLESQRKDKAKLEMDVARLKRINLIDSMLEKTEPDLEALKAMIPQLEEDYTRMGAALDTTRHQLPTKDIYIPQGSEEEKDEYEEKLEKALQESEQLLAEVSTLTDKKTFPLSQYLDNIETINRNLFTTNKELQDCQKDVETVQDLSTRLTSLYVQDMQSQ